MSHKPRSPGGETDMRIGVSKAEHRLLDAINSLRNAGEPHQTFEEIAEQWLGVEGQMLDPQRMLELAARVVLATEKLDAGA
jgi:hypothetical protein